MVTKEMLDNLKDVLDNTVQNYSFDFNDKPDPKEEAQTYVDNLQAMLDNAAEKGELYMPEQNSNKLIKCRSAKAVCNFDNIRPGYIPITIEGVPEEQDTTYIIDIKVAPRKVIKKVSILQLIQQIFPEVEGVFNNQDAANDFRLLLDNKIRAIIMSDDTNLTVNYNGEERIMRDADDIEYVGQVEDKGQQFILRGYLDDWTQYQGSFTIYPTD